MRSCSTQGPGRASSRSCPPPRWQREFYRQALHPSGRLLLASAIYVVYVARAGRRVGSARGAVCLRPPFLGDQFIQPADIALDRFEPVPLQFERVAVHPLPGAREGRAQPLQPVLEPAAPPLENPEPDVRPGLAEEGEVDAELVVLPGGRARVGEQVLEPLLALGGQPVDDLRPAGRAPGLAVHWRGGAFLGDQALSVQLGQAGVQGAVGQRAERAEQQVELLAELVAVHGRPVQQPEDGELEDSSPVPAHGILPPGWLGCIWSISPVDITGRYLRSISRFDISSR